MVEQHTHPLAERRDFPTIERYVLHLLHQRAYREACERVAGRRVLDWGCNDGYGIALMREHAACVVGLDIAAHALEAARERLGANNVVLAQLDGARSPFADDSFEVVTGHQLIEHIDDHDSFLSELTRVLAPDGFALFTTPNGAIRLNPGLPPWNPYHAHEFSPGELRELLAPWFDEVEILGLTGKPELIAIERARIDKSKWRQRRRLRAKATTAPAQPETPAPAQPAPEQPKPPLPAEELARFDVADLHYASSTVDEALDLMAICRRPRR